MKAIVVTGGTQVDWDNVRTITNRASGVQGMEIARSLQDRGIEVHVLAASSVTQYTRYDLRNVSRFRTYDDLADLLDKTIAKVEPDFLFMPAAISDAAPVKVEGKLKIETAEDGTFMVPFRKLPKILPTLREKCGPETLIVGFKLLSDESSAEDLMSAAHAQLTSCNTNMCVGNIVNFDTEGKKRSVTLFQLSPGGTLCALDYEGTKAEIANQVCDHIVRSHPKSVVQKSVVGVLHSDGGVAPKTHVLMLKRHYSDRTAKGWCLPGGKVEDGEDPKDALVREFKEETGLDVGVGAPLTSAVKFLDGNLYEIDAYEVYKVGGDLAKFPTEEHSENGWFLPQAPPTTRGYASEDTGSATRTILAEVTRRDEAARLWVHAFLEEEAWHSETVDVSEDYGEDGFSKRLDITADRMTGETVSLFFDQDGALFTEWVYAGYGGIDTPDNLKGVADTLASELASNDDGFGFSPDCLHPVLRGLMWPTLAEYWRV